MMAWMNAESFAETVRTGRAVYYSRSRGKLWRKGEESGHVQTVRGIYIDCDADTILLKVDQLGAACHEGYRSCFFREVTPEGVHIVGERLAEPEKIYSKPSVKEASLSPDRHPIQFSESSRLIPPAKAEGMRVRSYIAIGYFGLVCFWVYQSLPHYSTVPLLLMGILGLMLLALLAGVFLTTQKEESRSQFNLLMILVFIAACSMLLGTTTGLNRIHGHLYPDAHIEGFTLPFWLAGGVMLISFPFAVCLAEITTWSAAELVRFPRVGTLVRRLVP